MLGIIFKLLVMALAVMMIKYRERIGEQLGDPLWTRYVGGIYNVVIIVAIFLFFWALASLTGTQKIFFFPFYMVMGGVFQM